MLIAKLLCAAWLIRFSISLPYPATLLKAIKAIKSAHDSHPRGRNTSQATAKPPFNTQSSAEHDPKVHGEKHHAETSRNPLPAGSDDTITSAHTQAPPQLQHQDATEVAISRNTVPASKPFSLYPGAILGSAMVSRGEIGFLISSLAESNGIFSTDGKDQVFLIVTWAIVLCTIIGPVGVGLLVRRVKTLEKAKEERAGGSDVLGVWGVS